MQVKLVIIWCYHEFYRDDHDHRSGHHPADLRPPGTGCARSRGRPGRRLRPPGRQGPKHPPGLRSRLALIPCLGRGRRSHGAVRHPSGRGPLPGPPGRHRPVPRYRPAGPLRHFPLPRCRRYAEGGEPRHPPRGGRGSQGEAQPSPRGPAPVQARPRGRMQSPETARRRAALALAFIEVLADGGLRRSQTALSWDDVEL